MALRKYKPTSPGRRFMSVSAFDEITKSEPEKTLVEPLKKSGGRNAYGRITRRHQGGGHKRRYRIIDFKRVKDGVPAKVAAIEYDPNRSARIALLHYADGAKAYILAPARLRAGMIVESGPQADITVGNALALADMPTGTVVMFGKEFVITLLARMIWEPMIGPSEFELLLYSTLPVPKSPPWKYWLLAKYTLSPALT